MFINELSFQEKLTILRNGCLGFGQGIEFAAGCLGGHISWRGPSEYPNAVFVCGSAAAAV